jgi:hypothetical protein
VGSVLAIEYLAGGALPGSQGTFDQAGPGAGGVLVGEIDAADGAARISGSPGAAVTMLAE